MTVVLVHGVPETPEVWDGVRERLSVASVALQLPGFGCPRPDGFDGKHAWEGWLVEQLDQIPGPIDLVGHDWGSLLALRIATAHGHLVRSWAVDVASVSHPDYEWHGFAKTWQAPGGEAWMDGLLASSPDDPDGWFAKHTEFGINDAQAYELGVRFDRDMADSILALYRSAVPNVHADWGGWPGPDEMPPGAVLLATRDPFDALDRSREVAERLGAQTRELPELGHFWMLQDPDRSAAVLDTWLAEQADR